MKIICFYEPLILNSEVTNFSKDSLELIKLWERSWSNNGWDPIVVSLENAKKHHRYHEIDLKDYSSNLYKYSINNPNYLELCYSRWFAYACHDGFWSDYDVMNYGFTPEDAQQLIKYDPVFIDNIGSCGFATLDGHKKIIEGFIDAYKNDAIVHNILSLQTKYNQTKDISDMHINRRRNTPIKSPDIPLCNENFSNDGWRESKLVHYHNGLWNHFKNHQCKKRSDFIQTERPIGMNRTDIINLYASKIKAQSYLEIGVRLADQNFNHIKVPFKIGVDPGVEGHCEGTHLMTSDDFFKQNKDAFDLIFIDGLHESEQVLRDINNSLDILNNNGVIICHDMNPKIKEHQLLKDDPVRLQYVDEQKKLKNIGYGLWTGDCWKAFVTLRSNRKNLEMYVIDADFGVGVIKRGSQQTISIPSELTYEYLELNREMLLNLKRL